MGHPLSWCCMDGPAPQPLCVQASLRSLQASSPGGRKPSVALNAGLEGLLHPPPSLGGIVSHPRKEREDGAPSLVVLHGWASPPAPVCAGVASLLAGQFARKAQAECGFERRTGRPAPPSSLLGRHRVPPSQRTRGWGTLSRGAAWMGQPPASLSLFARQFARGVFKT